MVVNSEDELNEIASKGSFASVLTREPPSEPINDRLLREAGMHSAQERKHAPPQSANTQTTPGFQRRPESAGPKNSNQRRSSSAGSQRRQAPQGNTGSRNQVVAGSSTPATQTGSSSGGGNISAPQGTSTPDTGQSAGDPGGTTASNDPEWSFEKRDMY